MPDDEMVFVPLPRRGWRIRSTVARDDETGEPLYWSNVDGWGHRSTADIYPDRSGDLPLGGAEWERGPSTSAPELYRFVVCLNDVSDAWIEFYWSEDAEHAVEQADNAHPEADVVAVALDPDGGTR